MQAWFAVIISNQNVLYHQQLIILHIHVDKKCYIIILRAEAQVLCHDIFVWIFNLNPVKFCFLYQWLCSQWHNAC